MRHLQLWALTSLIGGLTACGATPLSSEFDPSTGAGGDGASDSWEPEPPGRFEPGPGCSLGPAVPCTCSNGMYGAAACRQDGTGYGACACDSLEVPLPSDPDDTCVPGSERQCVCADGAIGAASCLVDGSGWKSCQCGEPSAVSVGSGNGSVTPPGEAVYCVESLIDDFEDGDDVLAEVDGRQGGWFTTNDETPAGVQSLTVECSDEQPGAEDSACAAWSVGEGFHDWGSGVGVDLNNVDGLPVPYDASAYDGIRLCLQGSGSVRVMVGTSATTPPSSGGDCEGACWDQHQCVLALSETWSCHDVLWSDLAQEGWGNPAAFDPTDILELKLLSAYQRPLNVAFDEISFVAESGSGTCAGDVDPLLIDDLEDGDAEIPEVEGRRGFWYTFNDGTSGGVQYPALDEFSPATVGAAGTNFSARTWGEGFFQWGIALGVNFNFEGGYPDLVPQAYDATAYAGIGFYLKGTGTVRVNFSTTAVVPPSDGGTCSATCWDKYGVDFALTETWTYHEIRWTDPGFAQQGWGTRAAFDPSQLLSVEFQMLWATDYSDVSVDELRFLAHE